MPSGFNRPLECSPFWLYQCRLTYTLTYSVCLWIIQCNFRSSLFSPAVVEKMSVNNDWMSVLPNGGFCKADISNINICSVASNCFVMILNVPTVYTCHYGLVIYIIKMFTLISTTVFVGSCLIVMPKDFNKFTFILVMMLYMFLNK